MKMYEEKTVNSRPIFSGRAFKVRVDTIREPDGRETTREIVEHADCVCVVPVDEQGRIILVRQYRKAVERPLLEIPAGGIEKGESPEEAARRELQEEIGCWPAELEKLGGFYSSPGFCTEYLHLFKAGQLSDRRLVAEDTAGIDIVKIEPAQVMDLIASGELQDAKSIAGILYHCRKSG
jgi:ADP-ribose pyrophosphatase